MFCKHNFCVELDSFIAASGTMLSHIDFTVGELNVDSKYLRISWYISQNKFALTDIFSKTNLSFLHNSQHMMTRRNKILSASSRYEFIVLSSRFQGM